MSHVVRHIVLAVLAAHHRAAMCLTTGRSARSGPRLSRAGNQRGQATAEYALVLLGVAAVALLVLAWAAQSGKIGQLFDAVVDNLIGKVR